MRVSNNAVAVEAADLDRGASVGIDVDFMERG
jgi:hypothetical protein